MNAFHNLQASVVGRRRLLGGLAAMAALPGLARASAPYPSRAVSLITPSSAGGATDIASRLLGQHMFRKLGQPFVVDNKVGAAGMIAMAHLARSEPDGYTLGIGSNSPLTTSPLLYKNPGYDPVASFAPIGLFTTSAFALLVSPDSGLRSVEQLVARGKANPEAVVYSSSGVNGSIHLVSAQFTDSAGFEALHVPYKGGGDSAAAIMAGRVTFAFDAISSVIGLIKAGKLRPIAVSGRMRDPALPDVPTLAEVGYPALTTEIFYGLIAPAKTPPAIVAQLTSTLNEIAAEPGFRQDLARVGSQPDYRSPQAFGELIASENRRWQAVIDKMGVVPQ